MESLSEADLAWQAAHGNVLAFGELVQRTQASVLNVCYRLVGSMSEAEDMAQDAYLRAYQRLHLYDPQRPFGPWMRRVAANVCINYLKSQTMLEVELDEESAYAVSDEMNPESKAAQRSEGEAVLAAVLSLPPHYRVVIELRHFQGLNYEEIAAELSLPLSDVKSHLFRARRLLAARLQPQASESHPANPRAGGIGEPS